MINFIKDIINDTLKNKDNKFSSKKIMSCVAYNSAVLMCWIDMLTKKVYSADINTIILLLSIAGYSSTLTVYSNKKT
jgi:hypothetical protein